MYKKVMTATAIVVGTLGMAAGPAAAASGTLTASYGKATYNWDSYRSRLTGTVYDTLADGRCVRVYDQGYNHFLGWGGWNYLGQACGRGDHTGFGETVSVYSDKVNLIICQGTTNCVAKRVWG